MTDSVIDRLSRDHRFPEVLSDLLGVTIRDGPTKAIRCLHPDLHANGDGVPSMIVQPRAGGVSCSCGLSLGLLGIVVDRGLAPDDAGAAKYLETRYYGTNGASAPGGNGHHAPSPPREWPYFPKTAERFGWQVIEDRGVPALRVTTHGPDGTQRRSKIRRKTLPNVERGTFLSDGDEIGLLGVPQFLEATESAEAPTVALLAGETDLLAWTYACLAEGLAVPGVSSAKGEASELGDDAALFRGCKVVVLYDADDAGRKNGPKRAAEALAAGAASAVSIHVPKGKDVCEYVLGGGTVRELLRLSEAKPEPDHLDLVRVLAEPAPDQPDEIVERLITRPSVNIIFGPPSSGKSWGLMQALLDVCLGGGSFLGNPEIAVLGRRDDVGTPTDRVLWVYGSEDTERRIRFRLRSIVEAQGRHHQTIPEGTFVAVTTPPGTALGTPQGWKWLDGQIARFKPTIVVLDTIASLSGESLDASKAEQVVPFMRHLHGLRDAQDLVVFGNHHTRKESQDKARGHVAKADSMLGSQAWRSMADAVLMLDARDGNTKDVTCRLVKSKDIDQPAPAFHAGLEGGLFRFLRWETDEAPEESSPDPGQKSKVQAERVLRLAQDTEGGLHWNQAHKPLKVARSVWYAHRLRVLRELEGKAVVVGGFLRAL